MTQHQPCQPNAHTISYAAVRQRIVKSKVVSSSPTQCPGGDASRKSSRQLLFVYPQLPKWEMALYFTVVFCTLLYAWTCVFRVSQRWVARVVDASDIRQLPYFSWRFKDEIDWEWSQWSPMAFTYLPYLVAHTIIFNLAETFLTRTQSQLLSTAFSMFVSIRMFGIGLVVFSVMQGCFLFTCTLYSRRIITVWISSLPSLYLIMNHSSFLSANIFHVLLFASYTMMSYISFCLDWVRGDIRNEDSDSDEPKKCSSIVGLLRRLFFYSFYLPYLFSLIVTHADFEHQYTHRLHIFSRPWGSTLWRAVRVAAWWIFIELALHYFYFSSILHDEYFFARLPKNEFVTMGMAVGAFFHLKYVIIFGLPAVFALADGMNPPAGAICISRVALYSKIWRRFDCGLYSFFKAYIFLPICTPTFSPARRILGVFVSYLFVLVWHGFHHQNLVWIGLNIIELFIEYGAKAVYSVSAVRAWRERHLSDVAFRRLLGVAQIIPFAFGLYSNFYFLGGSRVGWLFVQRIFLEETITLRWPFFLLIFLGYFYTQVTMEVERLSNNNDSSAKCLFNANVKAEKNS